MPLKLIRPRKDASPNYRIRGTYLSVSIDRTTGTPEKAVAQKHLNELKRAIERGDYTPQGTTSAGEPTFADAALSYLKAGGDDTFLGPIIEATGLYALRDKLLSEIDQMAIDNAAEALYPTGTAATRNRQVYTPVSAVLKRAGIAMTIKRPKGWEGNKATSWLEPDQAQALLDAAHRQDAEFGLLCLTLLYTGMRLGDALGARVRDLKLGSNLLYIPITKNGEPRPVHLPPVVVEAMRAQPARSGRQPDAGIGWLERSGDARLFRFHNGTPLRVRLAQAMTEAGLSFPPRQRGFHLFCHTYGTWMQSFGGLDTFGLVRTGRWRSPRSADRYAHTQASSEAKRSDALPTITPKTLPSTKK